MHKLKLVYISIFEFFLVRGTAGGCRPYLSTEISYLALYTITYSRYILSIEGLSPFGYLPLLEVDGKKLNESMAIFRYVARQCGKF